MAIEKSTVFEVVKSNVLRVLPELHPEQIRLDTALTDLGANSVDRVEVAMYSLEDLKLRISPSELQGISDLRALVDLLHRHANPA